MVFRIIKTDPLAYYFGIINKNQSKEGEGYKYTHVYEGISGK